MLLSCKRAKARSYLIQKNGMIAKKTDLKSLKRPSLNPVCFWRDEGKKNVHKRINHEISMFNQTENFSRFSSDSRFYF